MKQRDRGAMIGQMLVRLGFVVAIVLGLGIYFGVWSRSRVLEIHQGAGILVLIGIIVVTVRLFIQGVGSAIPHVAALVLGLLGAVLAFNGQGVLHMIAMIVAVGLSEMGSAKAKRAATR